MPEPYKVVHLIHEKEPFLMNHLESRPLCKALGQTLIVRPIQPERDDLIESP